MDRSLWPSIFLAPVVFLLFELTGIDLWLQDHFYNFATHAWLVDADAPLPRLVFYTGAKALIWAFGLCLIAFASFRPHIRFLENMSRRDLWVVVLTLATAPTFIALGKATTDTFTPSQIRRYGGEAPYVKVIEHYPPGDHPAKHGRGFPAGHASGGFALLSLAGLATTRRGRAIGMAIGLTAGTIMGTYQMLKGAHYLSHTVVSAMACWIIFLIWRRILTTPFSHHQQHPVPTSSLEFKI